MEAPEKIYLYPSDRAGEEYEAEWGDKPWGEDYVEYTRTDVIVEKALKWMERFLDTHYVMRYRDSCEPIHDAILKGFEKYLKGE